MRRLFQLFVIAALTIISSCKKNESISTPDPTVPFDNTKTITTVIAGKVTAQDGTALSGVAITIGTTTTITDANGSFIIPKATLSEKAGFIKATKSGYFGGSRTIIAKEKVINNVVIQLVQKTISGDFINSVGGVVSVATGGSILFPANAVVTKSGAVYSGTVKVSAYSLDPTSNNCYKEMPGDLRGINASNNEQVLTSYGMMAVELNGSNGEPLQLATGKNATITFPIATAIQSAAPTTIPLWFFDETKGMWVEQGSATKTGNTYVGTVSHFTWWNCDWGGGPLTYTATFVDQNGNPLSDYHVYFITNAGWGGGGGHGNTASDGSLTGNIPANTPIIIKVEGGKCGTAFTPIYTATVGPFTQNTDAGTITVNIPGLSQKSIVIKGSINGCNDSLVVNGYAVINISDTTFYGQITNGVLNFCQTFCSSSSVARGITNIDVVDLSNLRKNSTPIRFNILGSGIYNIGKVIACGVQSAIYYNESFTDLNGLPLSKYYVTISSVNNIAYLPNSAIRVILPLNTIFTRKVYAATSTCSNYNLVDSALIGGFTNNFDAGTKSIDISQPSSIIISGNVTNCNNQPVASGFATIKIDGSTYVSNIINGSFSKAVGFCTNTTAVIEVVDNNGQQKNSLITSISNNNLNIGTMQACGISTSEFLTYQYDTLSYNNYDSLIVKPTSNGTSFSGYTFTPYNYFSGSFTATTTGTYPLNIQFIDSSVIFNSVTPNPSNITITEYGAVGQYIGGSFSGTVKDNTYSQLHQVSGSFRIKRTQ